MSKKYPKPSGPEVEFYLAANPQYQKGEQVPVTLNGYRYWVTVGARNTMPQEIVQTLQDAKSSTRIVDGSVSDPALGKVPRTEREFYNAPTKHEYISDFDVEIINVGK